MPRKRKRQPVAVEPTESKRDEEDERAVSTKQQASYEGALIQKKNKQKPKKRKIEKIEVFNQDHSIKSIAGYSIVPIRLPSYPDLGQRYIYYKENVNKGDEAEAKSTPNGKTLILVNMPVSITEEHLHKIFGRFGRIHSVTFKKLVPTDLGTPDSAGQRGVFAHLIFTSPKSVPKALEFEWDTVELPLSFPEGLGIEKWLEGYKGTRPDSRSIMAEVDAFMFDFDKKQEMARLEAERSFGKPDKDGFILVQKGRGRLRDGKVNVTATKLTPDLIEKSKKTTVLEDFYRFQRRENMRKQLADLRIRFEEDKKRIAKMRAQRRFRPG